MTDTQNRGSMLKGWTMALAAVVVFTFTGCGSSDDDTATKVGTVADTEEETASDSGEESGAGEEAAAEEEAEEEVQTVYYVGDTLMDGDMKIVYMASGVYVEESSYSQPDEGYQYIYLEFYCENTSDSSDDSISFYSFDCYADGYSMDMKYLTEGDLSATLSPGRWTTGAVAFTVPEDAQEIEIEYTTNYFTSDKITFVYQGEEDSGFVPEGTAQATDGAFAVGDIVEVDDLRITFVSCEEDTSDNMFITPSEGCHYVTCTFEFENLGDDDEYVSYYDFDCYADGQSCDQTYFRDDGLSATISSGRKASGTVTFEVPDGASVVEAEYTVSVWTGNRVVFTCEY